MHGSTQYLWMCFYAVSEEKLLILYHQVHCDWYLYGFNTWIRFCDVLDRPKLAK